MNFFKRLLLKLRKKLEPKTQDPSPPITISPPPPVEIPKEVKYTESVAFTAVEAAYLISYPDVAKHEYFGSHPYEHYVKHGKAEGRVWGTAAQVAPKVEVPTPTVTTERYQAMTTPFLFGGSTDWLALGFSDHDQRVSAALNFDSLMQEGGEVPAFDFLIKSVAGGAAMYRQAAGSRGVSSEETAQMVNKYGVGARRGFIDKATNEYVLGGNPFTKQGGTRFKLPAPVF